MEHLEHIAKLIKTLEHDIRAEVVINELQQNDDVAQEQYVICKKGQFSRAYRFDILDSRIVDYNYDSARILSLDLSRDGIYDMLPQGITHVSNNDRPGKGVDSMIAEYNEQKKEQKSARNFFQPFENEMFRYGVRIERFEREFLYNLNGSAAPEMFYEFWNIDRDFPPYLVSKFIRLLPFAYKIVGNISLAAHILSVLLGEAVEVSDKPYRQYADERQGIALGQTRLGLDTITGDRYDDYSRHIDIKIGPLERLSFDDFIHQGNKKKFIEMFYEHFFPIEVEINTVILLPEYKQGFKFNTTEASILNYNTRI